MLTRVLTWVTALALAATGVVLVTAVPAHAADFVAAPGAYTVDTTALTLDGPGDDYIGTDQGGVAVFAFENITILNGATLTVTGTRPLRLVAAGTMSMAGTIIANGASATDFTPTAAAGGPGGGAGAAGSGPGTVGAGPGGGRTYVSNINNGGGGGGHGGRGAAGAVHTAPETGSQYGAAYGAALDLQGGSGGGAGPNTSGGGGGGAVELVAKSLTVASSGSVGVDGGGGAVGAGGASGGGSGGGIRLDGGEVTVAGVLLARGGQGGIGGCCGDGGGGGGGRITLLYDTGLSLSGFVLVNGGTSGARSTSGCCAGGTDSVDPAGAAGVVSLVAGTVLAAGKSQTVPFGKALTLTTRLSQQANSGAVGGAPVSLYRRAKASAPWTLVGSTTTAANGSASVKVKAKSSGQYQWRFAGSASRQAASSAVFTLTVAPKLVVAVQDRSVKPGATVRIYGSAKPGTVKKVQLQRKKGAKWVKAGTATTKKQTVPGSATKKKIYVFAFRASGKGTSTYRVVAPAANGLGEGVSKRVTVSVS
jgi:hypothetical protein